MSMHIKWPGAKRGSLVANAGGVGIESAEHRINLLFKECTIQQVAYSTIRANVTNGGVVRSNGEDLRDSAGSVVGFVDMIIASLCVAGFAIWRWTASGSWEVAEPTSLTLTYAPSSCKWHVSDYRGAKSRAAWHYAVVDIPHAPTTSPATVRARHWRSAASKAVGPSLRLAQMEAHWLVRDQANSRPACFTTVDQNIRYAGKNPVPFFLPVKTYGNKNSGATSSGVDPNYGGRPPAGTDLNFLSDRTVQQLESRVNFHTGAAGQTDAQEKTLEEMVVGRMRALDKLTSNSKAMRSEDTLSANYDDGSNPSLIARAKATVRHNIGHAEHIVTDGREFKQQQALHTAQDATSVLARARQNVLFAYGVPPQATGEAINSERNASSHRQYEVAMNLARVTMSRFARVINEALETAPTPMRLVDVVPAQTVREVGVLLKVPAHIKLMAATHNIASSYFDPKKVAMLMPEPPGGTAKGSAQQNTTLRAESNQP